MLGSRRKYERLVRNKFRKRGPCTEKNQANAEGDPWWSYEWPEKTTADAKSDWWSSEWPEKTDADAEGDWWSSEWPEKTDAEAEGDWWSSKWPDATPDKSWM